MEITKQFVKEFVDTVPLDIYAMEGKVKTVGVHWGYCKHTDEIYGRETVLKVLDLLENNKEYQELLPN